MMLLRYVESKLHMGNEAMKQMTFGMVTGFGEASEGHATRTVSGRDEPSGAVVAFAGADRTVRPQGRQCSPAERLGDHAQDVVVSKYSNEPGHEQKDELIASSKRLAVYFVAWLPH